MDREHSEHEHIGYGIFLTTWLGLLVLTAITVAVAGLRLGNFSVLTAIFIATVKASAVLWFFMHLKYETALFKIMFLVTIGTFVVFIGLTFFDILFR